MLFTGRRVDPRPEDQLDAEIIDGAGELGFYSPHSWWPLATAGSAAIGLPRHRLRLVALHHRGRLRALAVIGMVFEYHRGEPAH